MLKAPELLLPAGSLEKMRAAYAYGADAIYASQPRYSMRACNKEFELEQLCTGILKHTLWEGNSLLQVILCPTTQK